MTASASATDAQDKQLVLGWKLSGTHPRWWITPRKLPAPDSELVMAPPESIAFHTAILAMSGCGKSFLLGRYIEEVITKTHAKCIVFDPNADFRRIHDVDKEVWINPHFIAGEEGHARPLPHEADGQEFAESWGRHAKRIIQHNLRAEAEFPFEQLKLRLGDIGGDFLAADLPSEMHREVGYVHDFLKEVDRYLRNRQGDPYHLLSVGERLFRLARIVTESDFITLAGADLDPECRARTHFMYSAPRYVSENGERAYFGAIRRLMTQGMIGFRNGTPAMADTDVRLRIVDLPSIPTHDDQLLTSHALLNSEWRRAKREWAEAIERQSEDSRVPTLLVIDEAHNLAPKKPLTKSGEILLDQVRTIVAEGRKFGLFVVLVSQRPDKLDDLVLSECENVALMRLSNPQTLDDAQRLLNLDIEGHIKSELIRLPNGQARIFGRWAQEKRGETFFCAARRTIQGGTNLRKDHWARAVPKKDETAAASRRLSDAH